jgi:Family of unknown function (DUF6169)
MQYFFEPSEVSPDSFIFKTDYGLTYEIRFKHTPYLFFDRPEFTDDVYELSVILAKGSPDKTPPDPAINQTVYAICQLFMEQISYPIFLFICDSSDGRQAVRARTFTRWFKEINPARIEKVDDDFSDEQGVRNYISFIIQLDHLHYLEAIVAFSELIESYNQPK